MKTPQTNISFWDWANRPGHSPIEEWQPEPGQLGWSEETKATTDQVNYEYDGEEDIATVTEEEQAQIKNRVARGKDGNALVPRSNCPHELNAILHKPSENEEADSIVDHYENEFVYESKSLEEKVSKNGKLPKHQVAFSTLDISAAQDAAVLAAKEQEAARILAGVSKLHRIGPWTEDPNPPAPVKQSRPLTEKELDQLMALPRPSPRPYAGLKSLKIKAGDFLDFRTLVIEKTKGINPGNSDADLYPKILDAMQRKEQRLFEEGRIDEKGRPLTKGGKLYDIDRVRGKILQTWFDEAMSSIDGYKRLSSSTNVVSNDQSNASRPDEPSRLIVKLPIANIERLLQITASRTSSNDPAEASYGLPPSALDVLADVAVAIRDSMETASEKKEI